MWNSITKTQDAQNTIYFLYIIHASRETVSSIILTAHLTNLQETSLIQDQLREVINYFTLSLGTRTWEVISKHPKPLERMHETIPFSFKRKSDQVEYKLMDIFLVKIVKASETPYHTFFNTFCKLAIPVN